MNCINNDFVTDLNVKNVIYGLVDPDTNEIRYIGKAIDLKTRIRKHYAPSRLITKTHKNNWINKLLNEGKKPLVIILVSELNDKSLNQLEIKLISDYKKIGCKLTNGTEGGDGGKMNDEVIDKMKKTKALNNEKGFWLNKKFTEEHCKNISEGKKGYIASKETREKLSKSLLGNSNSLGSKFNDESKLNMSKAKTGLVKNKKEVYQLDLNGNIIKLWLNPYEAEHVLMLTRSKIHSVCTGKRKTTGGFKWLYKEDMDQ